MLVGTVKFMTTTTIILGIVILLVIIIAAMYNGLVRAKNRVDEAGADIDVQLKRRFDLMPNLVETVKGYAAHEQGTFTQVIEARNAAMASHQSGDADKEKAAEQTLAGTLKTIFALSENYPDLKANQNFLELQRELTDTEDKIQAARRFYNGNVRDFNTKLQVFPTSLMASTMGFKERAFFEVTEEAAKEPVKVKFNK